MAGKLPPYIKPDAQFAASDFPTGVGGSNRTLRFKQTGSRVVWANKDAISDCRDAATKPKKKQPCLFVIDGAGED